MFTDRKRVLYLITIAAVMNASMFLVAYFLNLPLWLDTTGTIYISYLLGFPAGFIVAIINTLFQAVFFYGKDSLWFYFVSVVTALLTCIVLKRFNNNKIGRWLILILSLCVVSGLFAVLITILANDCIPANESSRVVFYNMLDMGVHRLAASAISVLYVKIPDVVVSVLICLFATLLTPKRLRTADVAIVISKNGD